MLTEITTTIAEGIASSKPTRVKKCCIGERIRRQHTAVSEDEIVSALGALAKRGLYVEPTSAAAAAGLRQLLQSGAIAPRDDSVGVNRHGSKHRRKSASC